MSAISMTIPEEPAELARWLEEQLVGLQLRQLLLELEILARSSEKKPLSAILGARKLDVLNAGLKVLPPQALTQLLHNPDALLDLQEAILVEGGDYWQYCVPQPPELKAECARQWVLIQQKLAQEGAKTISDAPQPLKTASGLRAVLLVLSMAACILLGIGIMWVVRWPKPAGTEPREQTAWGWNRDDVFVENSTRAEHLQRLADRADDWFEQPHDDKNELAKHIGEFRQGCSVLLLASHPSLPEADRLWLKDRCRKWATKFDGYLSALEKDDGDFKTIRDEMDTTVRQLTQALRDRASLSSRAA